MSNIHMDGFDTYATADLPNRYSNTQGNNAGEQIVAGGRFGGSCLAISGFSNSGMITNYVTYSGNTLYIGFAWRNVGGNQYTSILDVNGNTLSIAGTGRITVDSSYLGNNSVPYSYSYSASAVNVPLMGGGWNYFEMEITLDPTNGGFQVNVNGIPVPGLTQTGINTGSAVNPCPVSLHSSAQFTGGNASGQFDDWYINDTSSAVNNGFLGDTKVVAYLPSGEGRVNAWTNTGGTVATNGNYSAVNSNPADGDSSYVSDSNPGDIDAYTTTALAGQLAGVQSVHAVKVTATARKDDAATRTISVGVGNGTTESFGAPLALGTNYVPVSSLFNINPLTGQPWAVADVVSLQTAIKEVQ